MIKPQTYARRQFEIEAVQVTDENIGQVAAWCGGKLRSYTNEEGFEIPFIKVQVARPLNVKQTQAHAGDWVLKAGTGFKVYTDKAFERCFEPVDQLERDIEREVAIASS